MNKKKLFVIFGLVALVLIAIIIFIFLNKKDSSAIVLNNNNGSVDLPASPSLPVVLPQTPSGSSTKNINNDNCSGLISIEHDDCITKKALEIKDKKLCSDIQNASARAYCISSSSAKSTTQNPTVLSPYVSVAQNPSQNATINNTIKTPSIDSFPFGDTESQVKNFIGESTANPISEFFDRVSTKMKLMLFIINPTEVKSGSTAKATGSGFAKTGNTVFIGNESVTDMGSSDGMSISFTVPNLPEGRYETWITNSNGSSKRSEFPIYLTIANDATPPPTGLAVSPEAPKISDTITVSGNNLSNVAGVYTSLGTASGLSFKLQDLQFYSILQKSLASNPIIKAIPLVIMVMTKSGLSDPLMVNVTVP